jgi:hypothetical protein
VTPPKSKQRPHLFVVDSDVPPDLNGRRYCRDCGVAERDGDLRHTLPDIPAQAEHLRRYEGGEE